MTSRTLLAAACALPLLPLAAVAQSGGQSDTNWEKSYPVSGAPTLHLEIDDTSLHVHPCNGCHAVHVHITAQGTTLSRYSLDESQQGNTVHLALKQKPMHMGFHLYWHVNESVVVDVETPPEVTLEARASDGSLSVTGLHGAIALHTSDGSISASDLNGDLRLESSDGSISAQRCTGTLQGRVSDGHLSADGVFHALQLHASDGSIKLQLAPGSHLTQESSIHSSDGSITLQIPQSFPAELDLHSSDGKIDSALPLTVDAFNSKGGHGIHGKLDGGGALLSISTSDGSIHLSRT